MKTTKDLYESGLYFRENTLTKFDLPYLRLSRKININMFAKNQATCHWFKRKDLEKKIINAGFHDIEFIGGNHLICHK